MDICNHDLFQKDSTLIKSMKYKMVNPQKHYYFCTCCKQIFVAENGKLTNNKEIKS